MVKKITLGTTRYEALAEILGFEQELLESKKARLFPIGNTIDEVQTTSIFLSSLAAVKEYRDELLSAIGITKIKNRNISLHVFAEIYNDGKTERPDGLIVLTSGKNNPVIEWICYVEVKVRNNYLDVSQVERYLEHGKSIGIEALITISNEITTTPFDSPLMIKKTKGIDMFHWSWTYLKVMSTRLLRTNMVSDEDHIYILQELRRYFNAHKNIFNVTNMGLEWRDSVQTIHETDNSKKIPDNIICNVVDAYIQEEMDVALQLTDSTPYYINLLTKKSETRNEILTNELKATRCMTSEYYINEDKNNNFKVVVDLTRKNITCSCIVSINNGKAQAQTSRLLKMLNDSKILNITVSAFYQRNKCSMPTALSLLFDEMEKQVMYSTVNKDFGDEIKHFEICMRKEISKDMTASRNFIDQLEQLCDTFLLQVVRYVKLKEK